MTDQISEIGSNVSSACYVRAGGNVCWRTQPIIRNFHATACPTAPSPGLPDRFARARINLRKRVIYRRVFSA